MSHHLLWTSSISSSFCLRTSSIWSLHLSNSIRCRAFISDISFFTRLFSSSVATSRSANSCRMMSDTLSRSRCILSVSCTQTKSLCSHCFDKHPADIHVTELHNVSTTLLPLAGCVFPGLSDSVWLTDTHSHPLLLLTGPANQYN